MYEVVNATPKDVFVVYAVIIGSCIMISPFLNLLVTAVKGGTNRWR